MTRPMLFRRGPAFRALFRQPTPQRSPSLREGAAACVVAGATLLAACTTASDSQATRAVEEALEGAAEVSDGTLACGGATDVTITLTAEHVASATPVELMLVVDESASISAQEFELQAQMTATADELTKAEVEAAHLGDRQAEAAKELAAIAAKLGEEIAPAEAALSEEERAEIDRRLQRLERRRAQIGPVNPLAEQEYEEAREHVEAVQTQREDTERGMHELEALIRDIDREIERAFEQTFEATAKNFEEMVEHLFPGGRGRLRRVSLRPVRDPEEEPAAEAEAGEDEEEAEEEEEREVLGVEIEVTPAGKSTRKLSLLSGGEKSLVALAFVFAVFLARPCPFYILDEVEAALDDANIDRFLQLIRRFSDRAQFVIVTHQKRTMDAADVLYGVTMGGDGVTKVVSRRLPREVESDASDGAPGQPPALEAA